MNSEHARNGGSRSRRGRLAAAEPWASLFGGGALAVYGVTRKSLGGAALAGVGGLLIYHGVSQRNYPTHIHVERSMTVLKPIEEVYRFWRNFENLPRFISHLESVKVTGNRWSEWKARAPLHAKVTWHAEIVEERENDFIVWRSLPGSDIESSGSVQFRRAPGDRGTEVIVALNYRPPAGKLGDIVARIFGESPEQQVREDLRHFKQLIETGEIPTIEGQPHGRRTTLGRAAERWATDERSREQERTLRQIPA